MCLISAANVSIKSLTSAIMMCGVITICSLLPIMSSVQAFDTETDPVAFLPDWQLSVSNLYSLDPQFDEHGNIYVAVTEDSSVLDGVKNLISSRGIHIMKFDPNGTHIYTESIGSNSYCVSVSDSRCEINSFNLVSEDTYYIVASLDGYVGNLQFSDGTLLSLSSSEDYTLVAYHDKVDSWTFTELTQEDQEVSSVWIQVSINDNNELSVFRYVSESNQYINHELRSYSSSGGQWVRDFDNQMLNYQTNSWGSFSEYGYPSLMTNDGQTTHILSLTDNHVKYDSQTIQCNSQGSEYCYMWISINSNGVKTSSVSVAHPLVIFTKFEVINNIAYMIGQADNFTSSSSPDDTFFDNQYQNYDEPYTGIIASLDSSGNWVYHKSLGSISYNDWYRVGWYNYYPATYLSDGSLIIKSYSRCTSTCIGTLSYDGIDLDSDVTTQTNYNFVILKIDNQGNYVWHYSVYSSSIDSLGNVKYITTTDFSSYSLHFVVGKDLRDNMSTYSYNLNDWHYAMFWIDNNDGTLLDYEVISEDDFDAGIGAAPVPVGISPLGGVLNWQFGYYGVDWDADDIGILDNCPDAYNPLQLDYDGDLEGDACDEDDDNDMVNDIIDLCQKGELSWLSNSLTDHDGDGCRDTFSEDSDDDNDGYSDPFDLCPVGIVGVGSDYDEDGCKDLEDLDDDDDGVFDGSDSCPNGNLDWISGTVTDHDSDGCNDAVEDLDDDNDGILDLLDACQKGETGWPANINTDFDGDGCKDSYEDEDDDNDGILNSVDQCPQSNGVTNSDGCATEQIFDSNNGNGQNATVIYYVCQQGSAIVTDLSDCPNTDNTTSNQQENSSQFYFICPGGSSVVTDIANCPVTNQTLQDEKPANESQTNNQVSSNNGQDNDSTDTMMLLFSGGAFLLAIVAVMIVLLRKPPAYLPPSSTSQMMIKQQPDIPSIGSGEPPSVNMVGNLSDGYEWLEWPENSGTNWYRVEGQSGEWSRYQN